MSKSQFLDDLMVANDKIDQRMKGIENITSAMYEAMLGVEESIREIIPISKTVNQVALSIKLLAFNAAIEAARAGAMGSAFSVVADEVRQLAESSASAANETSNKIERSRQKVSNAVSLSEKIHTDFSGVFADIEKLQQSIVMNLQSIKDNLEGASDEEVEALHHELVFDPVTMGTGVESIDRQHMKLIDMIRELDVACKQGHGKEEITPILDFLGQYAVNHFAHEEGVMDKHQCPKAAENRAAHEVLLKKYTEWRKVYDEGGASLSMVAELYDFLRKWLVGHICGIDTCLRPCSKSASAGQDPLGTHYAKVAMR